MPAVAIILDGRRRGAGRARQCGGRHERAKHQLVRGTLAHARCFSTVSPVLESTSLCTLGEPRPRETGGGGRVYPGIRSRGSNAKASAGFSMKMRRESSAPSSRSSRGLKRAKR